MKTIIVALSIIAGIAFPIFLVLAILFRKEDKEFRKHKKLPSKKTILFLLATDISIGFLVAGIHTLYGRGITQFDMWANWLLNLAILIGFIPAGTVVGILLYFLMLFLINGFIELSRRAYDRVTGKKRKDKDSW